MTRHDMTRTTLGQTARRVPALFLIVRSNACWPLSMSGGNIERSLGHLSKFHLRDVGLTKADVEAACADSFDRSASRALKSAAQNRTSNW